MATEPEKEIAMTPKECEQKISEWIESQVQMDPIQSTRVLHLQLPEYSTAFIPPNKSGNSDANEHEGTHETRFSLEVSQCPAELTELYHAELEQLCQAIAREIQALSPPCGAGLVDRLMPARVEREQQKSCSNCCYLLKGNPNTCNAFHSAIAIYSPTNCPDWRQID